jgi:hypothetical protein
MAERIGGIERGILEILERSSMKFIRARLGHRGYVGDPPYSAGFSVSLILISSIELKEGNISVSAPNDPGPTLLIPSMLTESCEGPAPATMMLLLLSICTPGCAVKVE